MSGILDRLLFTSFENVHHLIDRGRSRLFGQLIDESTDVLRE